MIFVWELFLPHARLVAKQAATEPFGSSTASVNNATATCAPPPGVGVVGTKGVVGIEGVVGADIVGTGMVGTANPGLGTEGI